MKDFRFIWVVATTIFDVPYCYPKAKRLIAHPEKYSTEVRYKHARLMVDSMRRRGLTVSKYYGKENIPSSGPFVIYSNHQGKYDALGIILGVDRPMSVLWERKKADKFYAREVAKLCEAELIDLENPRDIVRAIKATTDKIKSGRPFLIFPEGGYDAANGNKMQEFKTGCFSCSIQTRTPIVPVCIYDSYKAMNGNRLGVVKTQIHFLKPIQPSEYEGMTKTELSHLVKERIAQKLEEIKSEKSGRK